MIAVALGEFYWYYYDGVGSVVALSKWNSGLSPGEVVERYAYGAFGGTRIFDAAGGVLTRRSKRTAKKCTGYRELTLAEIFTRPKLVIIPD